MIIPVLHEHGGHANHYLGDGLLAVFGAPNPIEHHADAAVASAVAIQRAVRTEFGDALRLGIGINTGPVIAGTVGGGGRHEFTVIGDTVNVAARVEQLTKETGDTILITEATRAALSIPAPAVDEAGRLRPEGQVGQGHRPRRQPVPASGPAIDPIAVEPGLRGRSRRGRADRVVGSPGPTVSLWTPVTPHPDWKRAGSDVATPIHPHPGLRRHCGRVPVSGSLRRR